MKKLRLIIVITALTISGSAQSFRIDNLKKELESHSQQDTIRVIDNGNGIPPKILDKIFQPFFTSKPTGKGTGLGLSLSYDIVKAHGGELEVETRVGEGTTFTINIPINQSINNR